MARRISTLLSRAIFGPYAWLILAVAVIPTLVLLLFTPTLGGRRRVARCGARAFFLLIGSTPRVEGIRNLPDEPCVVVANHASYLDGIILKAVLPPKFTFLIKSGVTAVPLANFLLRRIGSAFVDREDDTHRLRTGRQLLKASMRGESLAFFPEGMFDGKPGAQAVSARRVRRRVAGKVAGRASGNRWFPPHAARRSLVVRARQAIHYDMRPRRSRCTGIGLGLEAAARQRMLEHLGEPDLQQAEQR